MPETEPGDSHFKQVTQEFAVHFNIREVTDPISTHQYSVLFLASVDCSHSLLPGFFQSLESGKQRRWNPQLMTDSPPIPL